MENIISIKNLKKSFNNKPVLKNINIDIKRGENIVVLGKSGQGKSVTLKCIVGMCEADEGTIEVLGKNVATLNETELKNLRTKIGFLFQGGALYDSMSVRENLSFALTRVMGVTDKKIIATKIEETLSSVGLESAIDKMPSELSGGMKKRIALARTIIVNPEIILYDEPTTGLDTITSKEISELILFTQKKYNATSIIITHDMQCAELVADRVVIMKDGEYIAFGTYEEMKNHSNPFIRSFFYA